MSDDVKDIVKALLSWLAICAFVISIFFMAIISAPVGAGEAWERVYGDGQGDEVVLTNTPCTMTIPKASASLVPKTAVLYRAYAKNAGESGIHEGCWTMPSTEELTEAQAKATEENPNIKLIRMVAIWGDDGAVYSMPFDKFTERGKAASGHIEGDSI